MIIVSNKFPGNTDSVNPGTKVLEVLREDVYLDLMNNIN